MDPDLHLPETAAEHDFKPVLTPALAGALGDSLPFGIRIACTGWRLAFCPKLHGASLGTLFRTGSDLQRTVLVIRDKGGNIFGGYAPVPWEAKPGRLYYGTDEAFVFSAGNVSDPAALDLAALRVFPAMPGSSMFMFAGDDMLMMGGDANGKTALVVQQNLLKGSSQAGETFANELLSSAPEFVIEQLELWAIEGDFND
eukprot:TRINITY_DN30720_c0_g1_i1.p1 TRINITY_DN30720_c0_g1~~TRINITY_DN30720_c0_g1_i1.p1  ORF type:complete len:213 (-),score=46.70 TRINITY_DN30720_c0_g1_i1:59-655(-)